MHSSEIRERYLAFFESKGHRRHPSASLVPDDPTLLTTSAGMVQFKPYFLGLKKPPHTRLTTSQKCLRAKDLEEVGRTPRHHTFFEMLGNFSFGDYFKNEIIHWAWELLTEQFKLPVDRLRVSVYLEDEEAANIWLNEIGVKKEYFYRFGEADNYWPASAPSQGPNGPCGPCSEIFYDFGPERGCGSPDCNPSCSCERHIEIWNLVFMQFERHDGGKLTPLPKRNIDTGLGLERMASVLQGKLTNFETDLFMPIIQKTEQICGLKYEDNPVPFRVIADHVRGAGFLVTDGVFPSNEGRGYLLRKLIRLAAVNGRKLGVERLFLSELIPVVAEIMGKVYPEFSEKADFVATILKKEEQQFAEALVQGGIFIANRKDDLGDPAKGEKLANGEVIFTAYDTYGLPLEEAEKIVREMGFDGINTEQFNQAMEDQKNRSRKGSKMDGSVFVEDLAKVYRDAVEGKDAGVFDGYDRLALDSRVIALVADGKQITAASKGQSVDIILNRTPLYGEMGGQVGDTGAAVSDTAKLCISESFVVEGKIVVHRAEILSGEIKVGDSLKMEVELERRRAIMRHHTATHLLHAALREVLGSHVHQAGSYVGPDKLRFDFTHHSAICPADLARIEEIVNEKVLAGAPVISTVKDFESAKKEGAMALFGEKYGAEVRMVEVEGYSKELCGGTHVVNTAEIGLVKISDEHSIGSGMRRIEAVAGKKALEYINEKLDALDGAAAILKVKDTTLPKAIENLLLEREKLQREVKKAGKSDMKDKSNQLLESAEDAGGVKIIAAQLDGLDIDALRTVYDEIKGKLDSYAVLLGSNLEGKASLLLAISEDVAGRGLDAGSLIKEIAKAAKGGGGGSKTLAQAGGKDGSKIPDALKNGAALIKGKLS
ncbi:MAG: alanine--tRNA ligase [bacterium]